MGDSSTTLDFESLFRGAPGICLVLETGFRIRAANDNLYQATGLGPEDVLGRDFFELFPANPDHPNPDGPARLRESFERVVATGAPDRLTTIRYDLRFPNADARGFRERYWDALNYPLIDPEGRITHIVHQSEEISELVRLRRHESRHATLLAEAINLHRAVYDQGIFSGRLDLEGRVTDVNRAALEQCGFKREDVMGLPFWECGWWNRSARVQAWVKAAFEQARDGQPFRGESAYFRADGTERIVEFACMPIKDETGRVLFVVPTGIDVTERVHAERDTQAHAILESITDAFFALDHQWRFTYVNGQAQRVLDRGSAELIGRVIWDAYPGLIGSEFEQAYRRAMDERMASSVTMFYPDHDRWYEVHAYPSPDGVSVYFRDATEPMRAAERLRLSEHRYRSLFDSIDEGFTVIEMIFDSDERPIDYRFLEVNPAFEKHTGLRGAQGRTAREMVPDLDAFWFETYGQVARTGVPKRFISGAESLEGRWFDVYAFRPEGEPNRVALLFKDITEARRAEQERERLVEQLREADRSKDEFLAMLAHELRNPLASISNASQVARLTESEEDRARSRDVIDRQVKHLAHLIDDLLDASRVTLGKIRLQRQLVELNSILGDAAESTRPLIEERGHRLHVSFAPGRPKLLADPTRIEQVVVNLLSNASKYTEPGGEIWLSATPSAGEIVVRVRDTGIGLSAEALPRMFELFAQGDRSLARSEGGLGIGLTLVRALTEMHGGRVSAHSDGPGLGSEFTVTLPIDLPATTPVQTEPDATPTAQAARILVVDDDEDIVYSLSRWMQLLGHSVQQAHDGPTAIELARTFRPEFVLLDIGLPGMDGYQIATRLRAEEACRGSILIAISGYTQDEDRRRSREAGFDHHLAKPVDQKALRRLLAHPPSGRNAAPNESVEESRRVARDTGRGRP